MKDKGKQSVFVKAYTHKEIIINLANHIFGKSPVGMRQGNEHVKFRLAYELLRICRFYGRL